MSWTPWWGFGRWNGKSRNCVVVALTDTSIPTGVFGVGINTDNYGGEWGVGDCTDPPNPFICEKGF